MAHDLNRFRSTAAVRLNGLDEIAGAAIVQETESISCSICDAGLNDACSLLFRGWKETAGACWAGTRPWIILCGGSNSRGEPWQSRKRGESFRYFMENHPGDGHTCALRRRHILRSGTGSISCSDQAASRPQRCRSRAPPRTNSAMGEMATPNGFLSSDEERTGQRCGGM